MGDKPSRQIEQVDYSSSPDFKLLLDALSTEPSGRLRTRREPLNLPAELPEHAGYSMLELKRIHLSNGAKSISDAKDMIKELPENERLKVESAMDKLRWSEPSQRSANEKEVLKILGPDISAKVNEGKNEYEKAASYIDLLSTSSTDLKSKSAKFFSKSAISCHQSANVSKGFDLYSPELREDHGKSIWKVLDSKYEKTTGVRRESVQPVTSELADIALKLFPHIDLNSDGKLSRKELTAALKDPVYKDKDAQVLGALYMERKSISKLGDKSLNDNTISREKLQAIVRFSEDRKQSILDLNRVLDLTFNHKDNRFKALYPREQVLKELGTCKQETDAKIMKEVLEKIPEGPLSYEKLLGVWKGQLSENPEASLVVAVDEIRLAKEFFQSNSILEDQVLKPEALKELVKNEHLGPRTERALISLMEKNGGCISVKACNELMAEVKESGDAKFFLAIQFLKNGKSISPYFDSSEMAASLAKSGASEETKNAFARVVSKLGDKVDEDSIPSYFRKLDSNPISEILSELNRDCRKAAFSQEKDDCHNLYGPGGAEKSINADAVNQGSFGNCYFAAALSSVAESRPGIISQMIKDNQDGTYTVTFRGDPNNPIRVSHPTEAMLGIGMEATSRGIWPRIVEEAFGEYCRQYYNDGPDEIDLQLSGNGGSAADALTLLTGRKYVYRKVDEIRDLAGLADAFKCKSEPTVLSIACGKKPGPAGFASGHAYTLRFRPEMTNLRVRNPWGGQDNTVTGNLEIDLDRIRKNFDRISVPADLRK